MSGTIAVIVPSFNRPRMLREALASIDGADQIIVADDGSDFDVRSRAISAVAEAGGYHTVRVIDNSGTVRLSGNRRDMTLQVIENPPLEPWQRMRRATCGALINRALRAVETDYVAYCCDDDLLSPEWLPAAVAWLDTDGGSHMVRGDWLKFNDGEPLETAEPCVFDITPELTTGNFAHRTECCGGCGCWWNEDTVSCHDYAFIDQYLRRHGSRDIAHVGTLAGYRREHEFNMLRWMGQHNDYKPETLALFESGVLEPVL